MPDLDDDSGGAKRGRRLEPKRKAAPEISAEDKRKAAVEFEREQKKREAERRRQEAARAKERATREKLIVKAQAALEAGPRQYEERREALNAERLELEKRIEAQEMRWESERRKLNEALRQSRD